MLKIQTLNKISNAGLDQFNLEKYTYASEIEDPDAVIVRSAAMHDMPLGKNLKAIARAGAGTNNIPIDECSKQGIVVFNTPGANANAVKEMVLCALLLSSRKMISAYEWVKTLKGTADAAKMAEKGKSQFVGPEIKGKKLGVIGLGAVGRLVANMATDLGMEVYGCDPFLSVDAAWAVSSKVKHVKAYSEIYAACDYITIHVPYNAETKEMINSETLSQMKTGVRILNFSRGEIVCNADILAATESGHVACYVTDFADDAILGKENIIVFPHLAASTPESEENCAYMAAMQLIDFLENGNITNSVNLPNVSSPRTTDYRICVIHKNVPNMIATISAALSANNINIETVTSKSKKEYAYTMLDIANTCSAETVEKLLSIEGIHRTLLF